MGFYFIRNVLVVAVFSILYKYQIESAIILQLKYALLEVKYE